MSMPIHQLLLKYNITAFFHGHDHFYGHQQREGIHYQEVPQTSVDGQERRDNPFPRAGEPE